MKLSEVIAPTPSPFKAPAAPASPNKPVTANTAVAGTANVANAATGTGTVSSTAPVAPPKPMPQQGVDALAQVIKSAGLTPSQLNQIVTKAK